MFECNIWMQCAPLWHILNIYKEWEGTSWPCTQLQGAIRKASVLESCSGLAMHPKRFLVKVAGKSLLLHGFECLSATFECSARPFETFWTLTRNKWGPADHVRSCKKQSEPPKCLRVAAGWPWASSVSVKSLQNNLVTCRWMFECNISMQCAPLWNILNIYKEWMGTKLTTYTMSL